MRALVRQTSLTAISHLRFGCWLLSFIVLLRMGIVDACAQGTIYTDRSLFTAALQSSSTSTFEFLTPSTVNNLGLSSVFDGQISVTSSGGRLFVCNPGGVGFISTQFPATDSISGISTVESRLKSHCRME